FKEEDTEGRRFYNLDILLRIVYSIGKHKSPEMWRVGKDDKKYITEKQLKKFIELFSDCSEMLEYKLLKDLLESNLYFAKVKKEEFSSNKTYDFTIPETHNFCANGIINHNSETQARRVTFTEVWNRFQSPFNKDYFPPEPQFNREIRISANNTCVFAGTSSALSALGYNLFGGVIDEAAFLDVVEESKKEQGEVFDAAEMMYYAIYNRMLSRFAKGGKLPGLICMVSSPRFPDDFMHRKIDEAIKMGNDSGIFWRRRST